MVTNTNITELKINKYMKINLFFHKNQIKKVYYVNICVLICFQTLVYLFN